jgi:hypothetical protein
MTLEKQTKARFGRMIDLAYLHRSGRHPNERRPPEMIRNAVRCRGMPYQLPLHGFRRRKQLRIVVAPFSFQW